MNPGDVLSHADMCAAEGQMLQRGMTFRRPPDHGIILMSLRQNAPYADSVGETGDLIYEGHDAPRAFRDHNPKQVDQPRTLPSGRPTENGKFADWVDRSRNGSVPPARFNVYEKLRDGIWSFRGAFLLVDYRFEPSAGRNVFKFVLRPAEDSSAASVDRQRELHELQTRQIPTWVKQVVYKRDKGRCVVCGEADQLHFDHDLPYSKGGSSALPQNVRLLCARHNLSKGARIE